MNFDLAMDSNSEESKSDAACAAAADSSSSKFSAFLSQFPVFRNQVAGHYPLLWHSGTICKPLIPAEYDFYSSLEYHLPEIIPYCAKYYGVMDLERLTDEFTQTQESHQTTPVHAQTPNNNAEPVVELPRSPSASSSLSLAADSLSLSPSPSFTSSTLAILNPLDTASSDASIPQPADSPPIIGMSSSLPLGDSLVPQKPAVLNSKRAAMSRSQVQYLVLEDLTFPFLKPCILDIKIGTRQHSDNESAAKIARKTARCLNTTSASLGLRICGVQVYWPTTDSYVYRDKLFGRSLNPGTFKSAVREFFFDGNNLLVDRMKTLLHRLIGFRNALLSENSCNWRFYSASLLIIYEGSTSDCSAIPVPQPADIDFSTPLTFPRCVTPTASASREIPMNSPHTAPQSQQSHCDSSLPIELKSKATNNIAADMKSQFPIKIYNKKRKTTQKQARERSRLHGFVDCRMIDFAHTSRSSNQIGVDEGVIYGFNNLIQLISDLIQEADQTNKEANK